jgi:hypothetical protein
MAKKRFLAELILLAALVGPVHASPPTTAVLGTPPQPGWSLLTTEQKIILAPLAGEWDQLENIRRKKWLGIAERFPNMSPEEQGRVQQRMREWANLSPERRAKVRDSYKEFQQLPADRKLAVKQKWDAYYSSLPDDEKQRIREGGKLPKPVKPPAEQENTISATPAVEEKPIADKPEMIKH